MSGPEWRLPEEVRNRARMFVLDGMGVMLGAVAFAERDGDRCLERYLEAAATPGPATVAGMGRKTTPMMAAFANGSLSEVLDCQDSNLTAKLHNGAAIIPTALAMGEVLASGGFRRACERRALLATLFAIVNNHVENLAPGSYRFRARNTRRNTS